MQSLGGIKPLKSDKIDPQAERPRPKVQVGRHKIPTDPIAENAAASGGIALESWFSHGLQKKRTRAIRAGQVAIDLSVDLHGFSRDQALRELTEIFSLAHQQQLRLLLVVHGKGYHSERASVLKPLLQRWLADQPRVLGWCPAIPRHGGSGATYVYLKRAAD